MSNQQDSVARVIKLLQNAFGDNFKTYYDGDPEQIPLFNMPAIIVDQISDETTEAAYGQDDVTDQMVVKVVLNKRDDFAGEIDLVNMTAKRLRDIISKRDPVTHDYFPNTVKGVLRQHLTDDITALAPTMNVDYGIRPRGGGEDFATFTAEGHVTFSLTYSVNTN